MPKALCHKNKTFKNFLEFNQLENKINYQEGNEICVNSFKNDH